MKKYVAISDDEKYLKLYINLLINQSTSNQMITFTHVDGSVSLEPSVLFNDDLTSDNNDNDNSNESKNRILSIDGTLHSLFETRMRNSRQNIRSNKGIKEPLLVDYTLT